MDLDFLLDLMRRDYLLILEQEILGYLHLLQVKKELDYRLEIMEKD